ncbi:hypothetical protein [Cyanobium sp. Morenito 9A2]|uniref:hypothetical protein n=1 Tax=Cyanobium sp. Morenito 9A2 TaxID=2823718 RepID=UPI0020CF17A1|nr:hypothetical protein [Cyanobium sp. Morenito 9A2]MCP9849030.1 hypothetical protein [Cyanobium sp. Morenito 9A2]
MNLRLVAFAALITALLGALFGSTLSYLGQPDQGRLLYQSAFYRNLYDLMPMIGAALGAVFGAGFAVIAQSARRRDAPRNRR